jgi:hypothetical protein
MKYTHVYVLFLVFVFHTSCGQSQTNAPKDISKSETKDLSASRWIYSNYAYTDSIGKHVIIQNSFPKGGTKYTDPNGEVYTYAVFFTRIINETDNPLELKINFPVDPYEHPDIPGQYFKIFFPPDTMVLDKEPLFNYGLTDLKSFLDNNRHKPSSLKRTINPKESGVFYVVNLNIRLNRGWQGEGGTREGFSLKEQNLYYRIKNDGSKSKSSGLEIHCGSINLNLK